MENVAYKYGSYTKWRSRLGPISSPMLHECCMIVVQHMFYESFGTQNLVVAFILKFGLRKGQFQFKLDQIKSNVQIHFFYKNICFVKFYLRIPKPLKNFSCNNHKCKKKTLKSDVVTFSCFSFCHCTAKKWDISLKFGRCVVCFELKDIYSVCWGTNSKFWILQTFFWKKRNFEIWRSKSKKNIKNPG